MRILLDTNAYSALVEGQSEIGRHVQDAEGVLISTVVLGELCLGFITALD
jgi:predicted nucleic acid-binding protein